MRIEVVEEPDEADRHPIERGLDAFNASAEPRARDLARFAAFVEDGAGKVGGLLAYRWAGWLFVDLLALPPDLRGNRLGSRLIRAAEQHAHDTGCLGLWLDTLDIQARPFYEKQGFACFAVLDDYPAGHTLNFMVRRPPRAMGTDLPEARITAAPTPADRAGLGRTISDYNDSILGPPGRVRAGVLLRDDAGAVVGGALARWSRRWVFLEALFVPDGMRGRGLGRTIMARLDAWARTHGLDGTRLDTMTWQAPGFFARLGFTEFARIAGYPPPHDRVFMVRRG